MVLFLIFGIRVTDANTPYRLMPKKLLQKYIVKVPENFNLSNVMLTVLFLRGKENVQFIPITFRPRQGGVNSINLKKITKIGIQAVKDFRIYDENYSIVRDIASCSVVDREAGCGYNKKRILYETRILVFVWFPYDACFIPDYLCTNDIKRV